MIRKKKITAFLLAAFMCISLMPAMAEEQISVLLDGSYVEFDVLPAMINDRTMVPVRAIFEALGAEVDWDDENQTVHSSKGDVNVDLTIGENAIVKNGVKTELDVAPQLVGDRTLVPVRAISEAFGCRVDWNNAKNTVIIVSDLSTAEVMTVNEESVSAGYFNYCLSQVEAYAIQSFNCSYDDLVNMWDTSLGDTSFGRYLTETTVEQCAYIRAAAQQAKLSGITLTEADEQEIEKNSLLPLETYGEEGYQRYLDSCGTTPEDIERFYADMMYADKLYDALSDEYGMSDDDIVKYLDDNYIQAKHILFMTSDSETGEPLSDEQKAEKKKLADETLESIKKGGDFDKLMNELSEDTGLEAYPDGYLFTKNEMVKQFEDAAFALEIGNVSPVVESPYGYHIIKRVAPEYTEEYIEAVKQALVDDKVSVTLESYKSSAKLNSNSNIIETAVPVGVGD